MIVDMKCWLLTVFFSMWMQQTSAISIQLIPQYPAVGQSVTFNIIGGSGQLFQFRWYKGQNANNNNVIIPYFASPFPASSTNFPRAKGFSNGSLQISNLALADQGKYNLEIIYAPFATHQASVNLIVFETTTPQMMESPSSSDTAVIVGIICGTILGIVLIVTVAILLYKRFVVTTNQMETGHYAEVQGPLPQYYNEQSISTHSTDTDTEVPSYTGLQFVHQNSYNSLQG